MRYCRCIFREVRILYELLFIIFNFNSMKNYHNPNSSFFLNFNFVSYLYTTMLEIQVIVNK